LAYKHNVFVNCPFDNSYSAMLRALVFAVHDCGFVARCALELDDGSEVRISKIFDLISECQFGIHDLSRTELDEATGLPRFNMPLELGIFLGAKRFGQGNQKRKQALILDREPYRYQQFVSDIAGQDVRAHHGDVHKVIGIVRDWLRTNTTRIVPGGSKMVERYKLFLRELPLMCKELDLDLDQLIFNDLTTLVVEWLKENSW